jgi:hypothetical protein
MKFSDFNLLSPIQDSDHIIMLRTSAGNNGNSRALVSEFLTRFVSLLNDNDIPWSKVNKTGSDLADLITKSHTDLSDIGTNSHAQIDAFITANDPSKFVTLTPFGSDIDIRIMTGTIAFTVPDKMAGLNLTDALASVHTPGTGTGATEIQIRRRRAGIDANMLSTLIKLNDGDYYQDNGVIDTAKDDLVKGDQLYIDVSNLITTPPKGLSVVLTFS